MVGTVDFEADELITMKNLASWDKSLIFTTSTLAKAVTNLDETCLQIALVVSNDGVLLGTLTDGDIRRGLLRGLTLDSLVDEVMNCDPLVVPNDLGREMILQLMQVNKIHQLPVVDERRRVVGSVSYTHLTLPTIYSV